MRSVHLLAILFFVAGCPVLAEPLDEAARSGDAKSVSRLLDEGANIDELGKFGTALHWAALNGHVAVVELLLERGADADLASDALGTPLHAAAQRGHARVADLLLEHGVTVDARDRNAYTPLIVAAFHDRLETAEVLIAGGADVNAVGQPRSGVAAGEVTALHFALRAGYRDMAALLREAGAGPHPVESAAEKLAEASPERGREAASWCLQCHVVSPEDTPRMMDYSGPTLVGVFGREVASVDGYEYSDALRRFGGKWTEDLLYAFASRPMLTVPGTNKVYVEGWTSEEIADIVAYFKSQAR